MFEEEKDKNCSVCIDAISSKNGVKLKCGHEFHWKCLFMHCESKIINKELSIKCPECKQEIPQPIV